MEKLKQLGATYEEVRAMEEDTLSGLLFPKEEKVSGRPWQAPRSVF
jgi:hypothetical protein